MWLQPNRTSNERSERRVTSLFLSYLHRVREELNLGKTYDRGEIKGCVLLRGVFRAGLEKAFWKTHLIAKEVDKDDHSKLIPLADDAALKLAFEADYLAAGKVFNLARFRSGWDDYYSVKSTPR